MLEKSCLVGVLVWLTYSFLIYSRQARGGNLSASPRWLERFVLWRVSKKYRFHVHHAYWVVVPIAIRYFFGDVHDILMMISFVLVASDVLFHYNAHSSWGDPKWDVLIDNEGKTVFWK